MRLVTYFALWEEAVGVNVVLCAIVALLLGVPSFFPHKKCVKGRDVQKAKAMVVETNGKEGPVCLRAKDIGCFAF